MKTLFITLITTLTIAMAGAIAFARHRDIQKIVWPTKDKAVVVTSNPCRKVFASKSEPWAEGGPVTVSVYSQSTDKLLHQFNISKGDEQKIQAPLGNVRVEVTTDDSEKTNVYLHVESD